MMQPQLDIKILKLIKILMTILYYLYKYIYKCSIYVQSKKKSEWHFCYPILSHRIHRLFSYYIPLFSSMISFEYLQITPITVFLPIRVWILTLLWSRSSHYPTINMLPSFPWMWNWESVSNRCIHTRWTKLLSLHRENSDKFLKKSAFVGSLEAKLHCSLIPMYFQSTLKR